MSNSADRAYRHIKDGILSGRYGSGTRLPEELVAGELGLSRTPIRDALRRLEADQLLTITPNSGARVASWTDDELSEIAQMRAMLEGFAAELAAMKRSADDLAVMTECCVVMEREMEKSALDLDLLSRTNLALHRRIASAAGNNRLLGALESLWNFPIVIRKFGLFGRQRIQHSLLHHREILTAIETRDREWAGTVMRAHILAARSFDSALVRSGGLVGADEAGAELQD